MTTRVISAMKLITFLAATALAMLGTFTLALSDGRHALGLYAVGTALLLVLGAVRDYSPRRPLWEPRGYGRSAATRAVATEPMKLAA